MADDVTIDEEHELDEEELGAKLAGLPDPPAGAVILDSTTAPEDAPPAEVPAPPAPPAAPPKEKKRPTPGSVTDRHRRDQAAAAKAAAAPAPGEGE